MQQERSIVIKSNNYVLSKYRLNTNEQKLILLCISKIKHKKVTLDTEMLFELSTAEIQQFLGFNSHRIYEELHKIAINLANSIVDIESNNGFEVFSPFPNTSYKDGVFRMTFNRKLNSELLGLKRNFTTYVLQTANKLKAFYSLRLYEILKSYQWREQAINLDLLNLKCMLGICILDNKGNVVEEKYTNYADFKKKVLIVAQREITECTDIEVGFKEIKYGKKVTNIVFYIKDNENTGIIIGDKDIDQSEEEDNIVNKEKYSISESNNENILFEKIDDCRKFLPVDLPISAIQQLLNVADNNIEVIKSKYILSKSQKKIDNLIGWMISAISDDYQAVTIESKNVNKFNDFPQRDYKAEDYNQMEQILLSKQYLKS